MTSVAPQDKNFQCPRCETSLPEARRSFPWCECGWNLPRDPVERLRGWRRMSGRIDRRLGQLQARRDVAWLNQKIPEQKMGWHLLTLLIFFLGSIAGLVPSTIFVGFGILGMRMLEQNTGVALAIFLVMVLGIGLWDANRQPLPAQHRRQDESQIIRTQIPETLVGVADRLGVDAPAIGTFSHLPIVGINVHLRWSFPPRLERWFVIGLPVLAVLSVSEFKALVGHTLICANGFKGWLPCYVERLLRRMWRIIQPIMTGFWTFLIINLAFLLPISFCGGVFTLLQDGAVDWWVVGGVIGDVSWQW